MILRPTAANAMFLTMILAACRRTPDRACVPGVTQACLCGGGRSGVQICELSGVGYGVCDCSSSSPSPAVAAPPQLAPELIRERTSEAVSIVNQIYQLEISHFNQTSEQSVATFFAAPPTPTSAPTAAPYPANAGLWRNDPHWSQAGFSVDSEHFYQYQVSPGPEGISKGFTVIAIGDLDGDGVFSTFRRSASLNGGEIQVRQIEISNWNE